MSWRTLEGAVRKGAGRWFIPRFGRIVDVTAGVAVMLCAATGELLRGGRRRREQ